MRQYGGRSDAYPAGRSRTDGPSSSESLAGEYGGEVVGDHRSAVAGARRSSRRSIGGAARPMSPSISRSPDAVMTNVPALARRGINIVLGTTGWQPHEPALRQRRRRRRHRHRRRAELLDRRRAVRGDRRARGGAVRRRSRTSAPGCTKRITREEGRAVGHGAAAQARDGAGGLTTADRRLVHAGRAIFPGTHTVGFDGPAETITLTHTARDRTRVRPRRADGRAVGQGPARLVHDAGRAGADD